ncbi:hypothetical protein V5O48_004138 [Marasmius crinis-equi]|uniref:Uncharacterized protein n=1 Tax=Marasmius crinis-equi TaxID=585013 RepID=A0ABR3FQW5_9AGAR
MSAPVSSCSPDQGGILHRLSSIRSKLLVPFSALYTPYLDRSKVGWAPGNSADISSVLVSVDDDDEVGEPCTPGDHGRSTVGNEGCNSSELDNIRQRLSIIDTADDEPAVLAIIARTSRSHFRTSDAASIVVLESITEDSPLRVDFERAVGKLHDLCVSASNEGWQTEIAILESVEQSDPRTAKVVIESPFVNCAIGAVVEVCFSLRHSAEPVMRRERFRGDLICVHLHVAPSRVIDSIAATEPATEQSTEGRGQKRVRME